MRLIDAIFLGLIQGLTEFIPVSSSGHLLLADTLTDLTSSFEYDVLLNAGTLLALFIYFRKRIAGILNSVIKNRDKTLLRNLVIATIPAVVIGGLFIDFFRSSLVRHEVVALITLFGVGGVMIVLDRLQKTSERTKLAAASAASAGRIGLAQALALIPGVSRSGITIIAGRLEGLSYRDAAEFSFLLAIPALGGALVRTLFEPGAIDFVRDNAGMVVVGSLTAFVSGMVAISFMLDYLKRGGLKVFGYYRVALASVILLTLLF